ncbi:MAG TPA: F0F1 ATP synthase subunit A [Phycisphaerales bacterium]|nr:F0F1 ATP synthase subunit A [Phycisphaerales bacterium]
MLYNAAHSVLLALHGADDPLGHVVNKSHPAWQTKDGWWLWSSNQGTLVLAGLILILVGLWVASKVKTGDTSQGSEAYVTRNRFAHMIEVICVYLREEVARPLLHDRTDKLMPFLWTIFFFVLVNNLLGLIPITDALHLAHLPPFVGDTPTQNIWVTGTLAVIAAVVFNGAAIVRLGPGGFVKHMMGGLPWYMFPVALLLLVIEAAGQFIIKPFALALRLFANMTAGHVLIATLLGMAGIAIAGLIAAQSVGGNLVASIISVAAIIALNFLELFVAFLQAFVFMFLTTIFISLMDHHDEHGHEHEHGHAHGHEHAHA